MFTIAPTDQEWFNFLRDNQVEGKINFWTPTPWNIKGLSPGDKFYFMLKSPIRKIAGCGDFVTYKNMTINEAWETFGRGNGCASKEQLIQRLAKFNHYVDSSYIIGCIVLYDVVFLNDRQFADPLDHGIIFHRNIVKNKYYYEENPFDGLWDVKPKPQQPNEPGTSFTPLPGGIERPTTIREVTERIGQGAFRSIIMSAYSGKCCITGESTPELIEAAHIQPYIDETSHHVKNGLLLRTDFHKLYDSGLMYIGEDYTIHISPRVNSEYYRGFHGKRINLPQDESQQPSKRALLIRVNEYKI